nr:hypothetical protein [Tanacetum cinerariifolium]
MMVLQDLNQVVETLLVIVDEQLVLDMIVDEPLVLDKQLLQCMIADELVLLMVLVVEEMCIIIVVEELLKTVDCIKWDCIEIEDCCRMKGFATTLAVLVIEEPQSSQYGKSESISYYLPD